MAEVVRLLEEHPSRHGGRLGRHVWHDPKSRAYAVRAMPELAKSQLWKRLVGVYDQGDVGDCTAESICGAVSTKPFMRRIRSQKSIQGVYHDETTIDGLGSPYPPNDRGSSGL